MRDVAMAGVDGTDDRLMDPSSETFTFIQLVLVNLTCFGESQMRQSLKSKSGQLEPERPSPGFVFGAIKNWIEKRFYPRRQVNVSVLVLHGTQVQSGQLIDMSDRGFGLGKVMGLIQDEMVSVATQDGRVLEGRVVWVNGGRAGVTLISES